MISRNTRQRRGVILMVVLILLTLFAIVGITFVFYSQSQVTASRYWRETDFDRIRAGVPGGPGGPGGGGTTVNPPGINEGLTSFQWGLPQIIYDVPDDGTGMNSAVRGHSLARSMYGFNDTALNPQPYSGTGRWHLTYPNTPPYNTVGLSGQDDYYLPNYMFFQQDGFIRDPERYGARFTDPTNPNNTAPPYTPTTRSPFTGGFNVSFTYPDVHSMFVAAVKADGTVMVPSFHRPWLFNPNHALNNPANPEWTSPAGKYKILRPRPIDQLKSSENSVEWDATNNQWVAMPGNRPAFPYPADATGDVKNKSDAPGGNDSLWMDMDYPVQTNGDGRKYKALFAWLVEPLDNRVDLNSHGNMMGPNGTHVSHHGLGRWEVNPGYVLNADGGPMTPPAEWYNLLRGVSIPNPAPLPPTYYPGRYGADLAPTVTGNTAPGVRALRVYSQFDFNAVNEAGMTLTPSTRYLLPGEGSYAPTASFPQYNASYGNASALELRQHALLYDRFKPQGWQMRNPGNPTAIPPTPDVYWTQSDDTDLNVPSPSQSYTNSPSLVDLRRLILGGFINSEVSYTRFYRLCPTNFGDTSTLPLPLPPQETQRLADNKRRRNMVSTINMDVDRPAIGPWLYDRTQATNYAPGATTPGGGTTSVPAGAATALPDLSKRATPTLPNPILPNNIPSDFSSAEWRSVVATLERIDLNRSLRPYPHRVNNSGVVELQHGVRFDTLPPTGANSQQSFFDAAKDRQALAQDIYDRLVAVTGAAKPAIPDKPTDDELQSLRWLAQLAANIVDFIDEDEISTPFNFYGLRDLPPPPMGVTWNLNPSEIYTRTDSNNNKEDLPRYWVFGTELPAVVLNEVMAEYQLPVDGTGNPADGTYQVRLVAELHNPLPAAGTAPQTTQQQDGKAVPLYFDASGSAPAYSPYKIEVGNTIDPTNGGPLYPRKTPAGTNVLGPNDNVVGAIDTKRAGSDFAAATTGTVADATTMVSMAVDPQGYFLVSATNKDYNDTLKRAPGTTPLYVDRALQYDVTYKANTDSHDPDESTLGLTVALRRLANPHMPPQTTTMFLPDGTANPTYNPYITVDYIEKVPLNKSKGTNDSYAALGKKQPYTADSSQIGFQKSQTNMRDDAIQHTFGKQNDPTTGTGKYLWLQHLDRILISPLELLNVSGYRPHELTHQFVTSAGNFKHRAPWLDEDVSDTTNLATMPTVSHRLWRFFELTQTANLAAGVSRLGRDPGKININMVWDPEILLALCDPQSANGFTAGQIHNTGYTPMGGMGTVDQQILQDANAPLYYKLLASRTPGMLTGGGPSSTDRPFTSFGVGDVPGTPSQAAQNINNTLLRAALSTGNGNAPRLFELPDLSGGAPHPERQYELLNKLINNVTTRSNVFAVYLTVGFFDVTDDTVKPAKLGAECTTNGQTVRHRFFCIVDRTQLTLDLEWVNPYTGARNPPLFNPVTGLRNPAPGPVTDPFSCSPAMGSSVILSESTNWYTSYGTTLRTWVEPPPQSPAVKPTWIPGPTPTPPLPYPGAVTPNNPQPNDWQKDKPVWVKMPFVVDQYVTPAQQIPGSALNGTYQYLGSGPDAKGLNIPWQIKKGSILLVDDNDNQETVEVVDVDQAGGRFQAVFKRWHHEGFRIRMFGNPGPQPNFYYYNSKYSNVVPPSSIVQW